MLEELIKKWACFKALYPCSTVMAKLAVCPIDRPKAARANKQCRCIIASM